MGGDPNARNVALMDMANDGLRRGTTSHRSLVTPVLPLLPGGLRLVKGAPLQVVSGQQQL